jgi:signal transduction histidine kinase
VAAGSSRFSVRARVTAGATLVLVAAIVVAAVIANGLLHRALTDDVDTSLEQRLDEVVGLSVEGRLTAVLVPTGQDLAQVQVIDPSGIVIAATPGLGAGTRLDIVPRPAAGAETKATVDGSRVGGKPGDDYRLIARTVSGGSQSVTLYAVTSLATAMRAESHLRLGMIIGLPLVVALAAWLIWWVTGRALAPVDSMRAEVDQIQATDLTRRVRPAGGDSEIGRLGSTLNRMLDRLQDASDRQQLFAASASHELRSPLSAMRTELEVGLTYPDRADWPEIAADALVEMDRLEALARDLRTFTRTQSPPGTEQRGDLWAVITDEVARRHPDRNVSYVVNGVSTYVAADPNTASQVVRNLFDNAERHAATTITVTLTTTTSGVGLTVANDGTPIPPEMRERIFEPFTRLDEARSLDAGGSGLGLAIARAALATAGGTLVAADVTHGAEFAATFPVPTSIP